MLLLDELRHQFAEFLLTDPKAKWRMDSALIHIITIAYEQGLQDGRMGNHATQSGDEAANIGAAGVGTVSAGSKETQD